LKRPAGALAVAAMMMVGLAALGACSGGATDEQGAGQQASTTTASSGGTNPTQTTTEPASPGEEPAADEVVDVGAADGIDEQLDCVDDHLPDDVDIDAAPADEAEESIGQCTRLDTFGEGFGQGLRDLGLYTEAQVECLVDAYGRLTEDEIDTVHLAGVSPTGPEADEATEIMTELYSSCDAEVPAR
jgi:hypothetical protein